MVSISLASELIVVDIIFKESIRSEIVVKLHIGHKMSCLRYSKIGKQLSFSILPANSIAIFG